MTLASTSNTMNGVKSKATCSSVDIMCFLIHSVIRPIAELGGKARAMELMTHSDSNVRYRALLSVQQLVSQPWVTI
jgi:hypothetical protein